MALFLVINISFPPSLVMDDSMQLSSPMHIKGVLMKRLSNNLELFGLVYIPKYIKILVRDCSYQHSDTIIKFIDCFTI